MEHINNAAGWPFVVAGLCLTGVAVLAPHIIRGLYRHWRDNGQWIITSLDTDGDLRMMTGFSCILFAVSNFALLGFMRNTLIEARAFAELSTFSNWALWWIMIPSALLVCIGQSMVLWDGYSVGNGRWACVILIVWAVALWLIGGAVSGFLVEWLAQ